MPILLIASPKPKTGVSAIAAGLTRNLGINSDIKVEEAPAGAPPPAPADGRWIAVVTPDMAPDEVSSYAGTAAGVIVNHAPPKRLPIVRRTFESVNLLGIVTEDWLLASPTIGEVVAPLEAEGEYIDDNRDALLNRPTIASIAADPGQTYFARLDATSVIVRSDKPDLQLAALNAGATCLIVTGDLPILSYVLDRVAEDEIPLLRTKLDTKQAMSAIEELFGASEFKGTEKTRRIAELLAGVDVGPLFERSATG